ncbi:MAG: hypothetical protein F6K31_36825 [Symploca sp. SIO2G7]|nr:hypothetical protein [Symploca sp. SIO2G7]
MEIITLGKRILPEKRRGKLKKLLNNSYGLRIMEAHSGLSAIVSDSCRYQTKRNQTTQFDGLWVSSLTSSASKGLPDTELSSIERRMETIQEVLNVTEKLLIVDGDTGGDVVNFEYTCCTLESMGVSAIIIEDKQYPKRNSLAAGAKHKLEDPHVFANKIRRARKVLASDDFMIFARLESLISGDGIEDAISRARIYLLAGADGIMIHSKDKNPYEIYTFLEEYKRICKETGLAKPIICVPTTYNNVTDRELFEHGANIVIHANHLLRAAHLAMHNTCLSILQNDRGLEAEKLCTSIPELFEVVGFNEISLRE